MMKLTNRSIFLSGGAGFMGSHLVDTLAKDNKITVYDNFNAAVYSQEKLLEIPNVKVINGDIRDQDTLLNAMQGSEIVINLAAAHIRVSLSDPLTVHDVNTKGILTTLLVAKKVHVQRYIYLSSSEIYGSATHTLIAEDQPKNPTTVYGVSKYVGELYTEYFHKHERLPTTIIRLFNTYGPRAHFENKFGEVIPRMCVRALAGEPPVVYGDGSQTRDFTYITDTIRGIILACESDALVGDVVNIAYGEEVSIKRVVEAICKKIGYTAKPTSLPARPNDVMRHAADTSKAKRLLGWSSTVSVEEGISTYIDWLKQTYPDPKLLLNVVPETNW